MKTPRVSERAAPLNQAPPLVSAELARQAVTYFFTHHRKGRKPRFRPVSVHNTHILLVLSTIMVGVIELKFPISTNPGSLHAPEDHHKFAICQVPCCTEGERWLRRTIRSLPNLRPQASSMTTSGNCRSFATVYDRWFRKWSSDAESRLQYRRSRLRQRSGTIESLWNSQAAEGENMPFGWYKK